MKPDACFRRCRAAKVLAFWFALSLAGCGGGVDEPANPPPAAVDYLPLASGNRWVHDDGSESRITGQRVVDGQTWWVSVDTESGGANPHETLMQGDAQGVRVHSSDFGPTPVVLTVMRLPAVVGDRYPGEDITFTSVDHDGNGTADLVHALSEVSVIGVGESVTTPAGTFGDTLHLRTTYTFTRILQPQGTREVYSSGSADNWYAANVGPVKFSSSITTLGQTVNEATLLSGYRVGGRSGGTLPPP